MKRKEYCKKLSVDPKFKRVFAIESMALGFPSIRKYSEYLADKSIKENKRLKDLLSLNGKDEIFE